ITSNNNSLHFRSTFTDSKQFNITVEFFNRKVFDKAISAENLDSFISSFLRNFACKQFCLSSFFSIWDIVILHIGGFEIKESCRFNISLHISKFKLNSLETTDLSTELFSLI